MANPTKKSILGRRKKKRKKDVAPGGFLFKEDAQKDGLSPTMSDTSSDEEPIASKSKRKKRAPTVATTPNTVSTAGESPTAAAPPTPAPAAAASAATAPTITPAPTATTLSTPSLSAYKLKKIKNSPIPLWDNNIWYTWKKDGFTPLQDSAATTAKCDARKKLEKALNFAGTYEHQANILHEVLSSRERSGIGIALGMLPHPDRDTEVGRQMVKNAREMLQDPGCHKVGTNDAMTFRSTGFFLMGPTAPPENAHADVKRLYKLSLDNFAKTFELTKPQKDRLAARL
jgi:hypothetical protein